MSAATFEFCAKEAPPPLGRRRRFLRALPGGSAIASDEEREPREEPGVVSALEERTCDRHVVTACFRLPAEQLDALNDVAATLDATPTASDQDLKLDPSQATSDLEVVRLRLPSDELSTLRELATRRSTTPTQVVIQALKTELFLQRLVDRGLSIVAVFGGRGREILFAHMRAT
jgi:hypothetical protein